QVLEARHGILPGVIDGRAGVLDHLPHRGIHHGRQDRLLGPVVVIETGHRQSGRLGDAPDRGDVVSVLRKLAPSSPEWWVQAVASALSPLAHRMAAPLSSRQRRHPALDMWCVSRNTTTDRAIVR